ncbi:MAG: 23S rRNA (adenine(2503)-C(2))-methyltransferase RlmN [Planctomycetes bacterium]|nr:23S rRNA (adenine(2503)-C(2))-methyltransferase RlmN [Planctomycetota bacterium]
MPNGAEKPAMLELTHDKLRSAMESFGQPAWRADQFADWVYRKGVVDPAGMSNLPDDAAGRFTILDSRVACRADSSDGTIKLLLELCDGQCVECVLIPTGSRATACLSTQVGCAMGCTFCASGLGGLVRNLSAGEILQQMLHLRQASAMRITNVVFMGMGEPLANYDATIKAIRSLTDPQRFGISARNIVVSTVGIPAAIRRLADEMIPITLAVSLHAPNDAIRGQIIPAAAKWPIAAVLDAARHFYRSRGRELTLEYVLLGGVNDSPLCADGLARIAGQLRCNVNLIMYNPVEPLGYCRPGRAAADTFASRLRKHKVIVTVRRSRGLDRQGACGQLRLRQAGQSQGADASQPEKINRAAKRGSKRPLQCRPTQTPN